jgi:periplasmic divalent cation tolerance protein
MTDKIIIFSTAGSVKEAGAIAQALVERKLAACVNIVPRITSIYRWKDKVEQAEEWLLVIKTTRTAFDGVRAAIRELHSYDVPECISFSVDDGNEDYLKWISESVVEADKSVRPTGPGRGRR